MSDTFGVDLVYNTKDAEVSLKRLSSGAYDVDVAIKKSGQSADYLFHSIKRIATYSSIFAGFAMLVKLIDSVAETELRLAEVQTLLERGNIAQAKSFELVKQQLMAIDPHLGTTVELVKGLYEIMSAGVNDPAEAMILLNTAAMYAKVGLTDLKTSAEMLTSVMKAYGFSAKEMIKVTDVLFASVAQGKFHAEDLNAAIGNVIPTAAAMGVTIQEVSAMLAFLSNRGLSASEAATALNRMLLSILRPTNLAKDAFNKLGIEWGVNAFKAESFTDVMQKLVDATARYPEMLGIIFRRETGLRAMFSVSADMTGYLDILRRMHEEYNVGGIVAEGYRKVVGTVKGEISALWGSMVQAANTFMGYTGQVSAAIRAFSGLASTVVTNMDKIGGLAAAYLTFHHFLGTFVAKLGAVQASLVALRAEEAALGFSDIALNQALNAKIATYTRYVGILRTAATGLMVATGAYILGKSAIDSWHKSLDAEINTTRELQNQRVKMAATLKELVVMYSGSAESVKSWTDSARKLADYRVVEYLRSVGEASRSGAYSGGAYAKVLSTLADKNVHLSATEKVQMRGLLDVLVGTNIAKKSVEDYSDIIRSLSLQLGFSNEVTKQFISSLMKTSNVADAMFTMGRRVTQFLKSLKEAMGKQGATPYEISIELDRTSISNILKMVDLIKEDFYGSSMMKDSIFASATPEMKEFLQYLLDTPKALEGLQARFQKGLDTEGINKANLAINEMADSIIDLAEKDFMSTEKVNELARSVGIAWGHMRDVHKESMAQFVKGGANSAIDSLIANFERLSPGPLKDMVEAFKALVEKTKDSEKAFKAWEAQIQNNENRMSTVRQELSQLKNELYGREYDNVVAENIKRYEEYEREYKKEYSLALLANENRTRAYAKYVEQMAALEEVRFFAKQVSLQKEAEAEWKNMQAIVELWRMSKAEKAAILREEMELMRQKYLAMGQLPEELMKKLLQPFQEWINKYDDADKSVKESNKDYEAWGRLLSSVNTVLKDVAANLGITSDALKLFINLFDSGVKVFNVFVQAERERTSAIADGTAAMLKAAEANKEVLSSVEAGKKAAEDYDTSFKGLANNFSVFVSAAGAVISAITSIGEALASAQKAKDAAKVFADLKKELQSLGDVSADVLNKIIGTATFDKFQALLVKFKGNFSFVKALMKDYQVLMNLPDLMGNTGITDANRSEYWAKMIEVVDKYKAGLFSAKEAQDLLGKSFTSMIEGLRAMGKEGSKMQTDFIKKLRESGLAVKEVTEYINTQLGVQAGGFVSAAKGLEMMAVRGIAAYDELAAKIKAYNDAVAEGKTPEGDIGKLNSDLSKVIADMGSDLSRIENMTLATFNAMIANGASYVDALNSIGPALDAIMRKREILDQAGIITEKNAGVDALIKFRDIVNKNKELFDSIAGNLAVMQALNNTASMTPEIFADAQANALDYFKKLKTAGLTQEQALKAMGPTLEYLMYLHDEYGYQLDAETLALIEQAKASGVIKKEQLDMVDAILGGIGLLLEAFGVNLPNSIQVAVNKVKDIGKEVDNVGKAIDKLPSIGSRIYRPGPELPPWGTPGIPPPGWPFIDGGLVGGGIRTQGIGGGIPMVQMDAGMSGKLDRIISGLDNIATQKIEGVVIEKRDEYIIDIVKSNLAAGNWTVRGVVS